tara:strand:- start:6785 stop:6886 length:102 start_codon:yes stop_codon:yes gene_type:complete
MEDLEVIRVVAAVHAVVADLEVEAEDVEEYNII